MYYETLKEKEKRKELNKQVHFKIKIKQTSKDWF